MNLQVDDTVMCVSGTDFEETEKINIELNSLTNWPCQKNKVECYSVNIIRH